MVGELVDLLEEEEVVDVRPKPPLATFLEGLRAWKLFWEVVGFLRGALMVVAFFPELGEVAGVLSWDLLAEVQLEVLVEVRRR